MKTKTLSVFVFALVLVISSCTHKSAVSSTTPADVPESFYGTYLFVGPCKNKFDKITEYVDAEESGLEAVILAAVVKTGIDWFGAALKRAASEERGIEETTVSSNLMSLSQIKRDTNVCLQLVRGKFKYTTSDDANAYYTHPRKESAPLQVVAGTEELFIEIFPLIYNNVIAFTPLEVRYSGYSPKDRRRKKPRELALNIGYALSNQDVAKGEFTGRLIKFGTLIPKDSKQASIKYVAEDKLSFINQAQWLSMEENVKDKPITLAATVLETRKPGAIAKFLAAVYDSSKAEIKKRAEAAVAELEILRSSEEQEKRQREKEKAYYTAYAAALAKKEYLDSLCAKNLSGSKIYNAKAGLRAAQQEANDAANFAGKRLPYAKGEIKEPTKQCD